MRGHIITCNSVADYQNFIHGGFAGLYPIDCTVQTPTRRQMTSKIHTNWDVIADLKRVKPEDYVFLHTEGMIYGPFIATSHFMESTNMPSHFQSVNLNIAHWQNTYTPPTNHPVPYPWRASIRNADGTSDRAISSMELFKRISIGEIQSVPQRFWYHDKPKIVKPLLNHEVKALLGLLRNVRSQNHLNVTPSNMANFSPITLDLSVSNNVLVCEKILEAWLMESATNNGSNNQSYQHFNTIFGSAENFANSIFTYYTNFLDVLLYDYREDSLAEVCPQCNKFTSKNKINLRVLELKRGRVEQGHLTQVKEYADWARRALADNNSALVSAYLVGRSFDNQLLQQTTVKCIQYNVQGTPPSLTLNLLN